MRAWADRVAGARGSSWQAARARCAQPQCRRHRCAPPAAAAAAAAPAAASDPAVRNLALLLLLHQNLHRRTGRQLLPDDADLLKAVEVVGRMDCAVAVCGCPRSPGDAAPLLYANAAAAGALQLGSDAAIAAAHEPPLVRLPGAAASVEVTPSAACVVSDAVRWSHQCSTGADGGSSSSSGGIADELEIDQLLVCPVTAPSDSPVGVALLFDAWGYPTDGSLGRPGFPRVAPSKLPDETRLQAAADEVRQQADHVRALKQQQGLPNQHPEVVAAVAELQARKAALARLEGLAAAFDGSTRKGAGLARWLPLPVPGEQKL